MPPQPTDAVELAPTDYLIVGSGAVGMAFADVLLSETAADLVIVDRHHMPGGHWNDAYPFVRLHQPSAFYGVSSQELSRGRKDEVGLNRGLSELASGAEVLAYFDDVLRHRFLPSGRVRYFPMCEYSGAGTFRSVASGREHRLAVRRKTVDATYLKTTVPSTHTPSFSVDEGVWFRTINELPRIERTPERYVIIGGGKTGIDACLWLLEMGVPPDRLQWVMPRDGWLLDRRNTQPGDEFFHHSMGSLAAQSEAIATATSIEDLFDRLEAAGVLLRIDPAVRPNMFHGATVSAGELRELRHIGDVVRRGRIRHLAAHEIEFEDGSTLPTSPQHLHVDCSASAVGNLEPSPIFQGGVIIPQTVRSYQPVFSSAFIAHVEAAYAGDEEKNRLCSVVPLPNHDTDWIRGFAASTMNQIVWSQDPGLRQWLLEDRLDGFSRLREDAKGDSEKEAVLARFQASAPAAMQNLQRFLAEIHAASAQE